MKINMKKFLMITCLNTSKEKFDGERIKNTLIYDSLKKFVDLTVINLSVNKIASTFKIFFFGLFFKKKFDYVVISKDAHGANIIHKILRLVHFPMSKVVYFEIGPFLYDRVLSGTIKKDTFVDDKLIIVETLSMKNELQSIGFKNIEVYPNFKPICEVPFNKKEYPKNVLKLVYLSRVEEQKGIYDLIECLSNINKESIKFVLDVFGRPQTKEDEEKIKKLSNKYTFVKYLGCIELNNKDNYIRLSDYDLHVFPTKYREGFPGTLIDFFIAGVPTLSSSFARVDEILSFEDSIIYKQNDNSDLISRLMDIYNNQNLLINLRTMSFNKRNDYSLNAFESFLCKMIECNFNS